MLRDHGVGRFAKRRAHTLPRQIVPDSFRQKARHRPPLIDSGAIALTWSGSMLVLAAVLAFIMVFAAPAS